MGEYTKSPRVVNGKPLYSHETKSKKSFYLEYVRDESSSSFWRIYDNSDLDIRGFGSTSICPDQGGWNKWELEDGTSKSAAVNITIVQGGTSLTASTLTCKTLPSPLSHFPSCPRRLGPSPYRHPHPLAP
jgi:hypothetical protein